MAATATANLSALERVSLHVRYSAVVSQLPRVTEPDARLSLLAAIVWPTPAVQAASEQVAKERLGL